MLKKYIARIYPVPPSLLQVVAVGFISLLLTSCGGGGGSSACVASVGVLGNNACVNATTTTAVAATATQAPLQVATSSQYTVNENQVLSDNLTAMNTNSSVVTYAIATTSTTQNPLVGPSYGTVAITNAKTGAFTYTPKPNTYGVTDQFSFSISSATQTSNTGIVYVTILQQYIPPVATSPAAALNVTASTSLSGSLASYVTNVQGNTLTYGLSTASAHGSVTVSSTGTFLYTPNPGYTGTDGFSFNVLDQKANVYSNTALVSLNVTAAVAPTITWISSGIVGIYNDLTAPNIANINTQLSATCSSGGVVTYSQGNLPMPPGVTITTSGLLAGSVSSAPVGFTPTIYQISAYATCPGANATLNPTPISIIVMPPNILAFTYSPTAIASTTPFVLSGCGVAAAKATTIPGISTANPLTCPATALSATISNSEILGTNPTTGIVNYNQFTWTPPTGVLSLMVLIVGGGGGGAGANYYLSTVVGATKINGSGGGAGGYMFYPNQTLSSSGPISIVVGAGGAGGAAGTAGTSTSILGLKGSDGNTSYFGLLSALGGKGGTGAGASGGAEPGSNAIPPFTTAVNAGGTVVVGATEGGGGGAAGAGQAPLGGFGAPSNITGSYYIYATGGAGGSSLTVAPTAPTTFGNDGNGGVGGYAGSAGISGDPGIVIVRY